jgi:hypothetical protein
MNWLKSFFTIDRIVLVVVAFLLYGNTLTNNYSLDDGYVTQEGNLTTKGLSAVPELLSTFYGVGKNGLQYDYRPLVKISFAMEHQFFGVHPGVSHFFNVVLYIFCLFLIYEFVSLLLHPARNKIPFYIALLFAFLPIHTEVVASIKNRDILLCFLFTLLTCNTVLRMLNLNKPSVTKYLLAVFYAFLAFLAKLDVMPYLVILPLIVFIKYKISYKRLLTMVGVIASGFIFDRILLKVATSGQKQLRPHFYFENPLFTHATFGDKIIACFNSLGFYLAQCVFPFKQSCYYGADTIPVSKMSAYGYIGVLALICIAWLLFYGWKKDRNLLVGVILFIVSLSMYLNLAVPVVGIVADRFTFFASFGFCIVIVFALQHRFGVDKKLSPSLRNVAILMFVVFGFMAIARNTEWKTTASILEADVKKYPTSAYLNYLDGSGKLSAAERRDAHLTGMQRQNLILEAKKELENSVSVASDYSSSLQLLEHILIYYQKDYDAALPYVNKALGLKESSDLLFYKGLCLEALKSDSSTYYLQAAIRADSMAINAYSLLSEHYNSHEEYEKSLSLLQKALQKGITHEVIYSKLAATFFLKKDTANARLYCEKILATNPNNKRAKEILDQLK